MDAKSEVLLRHPALLQGRVLLVNPPADRLASELSDQAAVTLWSWHYGDFSFFRQQGYSAHFTADIPVGNYDLAVIFVPKARQQLAYVLERCAARLQPGQSILLVGEKKAGIEGAAKLLHSYGKPIKLDSARHCRLWQVQLQQTVTATPQADWIERYTLDLSDYFEKAVLDGLSRRQLEICALPGVFSQNALDRGSALLLPFLSQVRGKAVLDFGCGAGVLTAVLAVLSEQRTVYAADVDAFALLSTELTFAANHLTAQLQLLPVSGLQDISLKFNSIVSNPPFHQGVQTDYQASETLCRLAPLRLQSGGDLWLVANRFLNYPSLLASQFRQVTVLADQNGYKIITTRPA